MMADSVARLHPVDAPNVASSGVKRAYSEAFKRDVVEKVRGGMSISQVSRTLGVSRPTIRAWMTESPPPPMSLLEAVQSGSRKTYLIRARDDLAKAIDAGMPATCGCRCEHTGCCRGCCARWAERRECGCSSSCEPGSCRRPVEDAGVDNQPNVTRISPRPTPRRRR